MCFREKGDKSMFETFEKISLLKTKGISLKILWKKRVGLGKKNYIYNLKNKRTPSRLNISQKIAPTTSTSLQLSSRQDR